jgi:hypothetical protein
VNPTAAADPELQLLEGSPPIFSIPFATSMVDGAVPANDAPPAGSAPTSGTYLGGVLLGNDWTSPWAYGLDPANRGEPLWFE